MTPNDLMKKYVRIITESTDAPARTNQPVNLFLEAYKRRGLMEGVSDRVLTKRKMIVAESRKLINLAESTAMPTSVRRTYVIESKKTIAMVKSGQLNERQLNELGGGIWGGVKALGQAAGNAVKQGANAVGNKVAAGANAVGNAVKQGANAAGNAVASGVNAVKNAATNVGNKVGSAVGNAANAVGNAANAAGNAVNQGATALKNTVSNVAEQVGSTVGNAANAVKNTYNQGANASQAKSAMDEIGQIAQLLTNVGVNVGDNMTIGQLKQALQGMAGGKVSESYESAGSRSGNNKNAAIRAFASKAHEEWRKGFDSNYSQSGTASKERVNHHALKDVA